jgi:hypothetical protein
MGPAFAAIALFEVANIMAAKPARVFSSAE